MSFPRVLLLLLLLTPLSEAWSQGRGGRRNMQSMLGDPSDFYTPPDFNGNAKYDGRFTFARIKYRGYECFTQQGPGWSHDYPIAESHFMRVIRAVTGLRPFIEHGPIVGGNILSLDDPQLFKYPVAYLSEPGGWRPTDIEVVALRNYLTKGGFMIVDDFEELCTQGGDMNNFTSVIARVFPKARLIEIPRTHAIFDSFFKINFDALPPGRGRALVWYGVFQDNDPKKRLMLVAHYPFDMGEYMEFSDRGFQVAPTNEAYKLGVNYIIYALTH